MVKVLQLVDSTENQRPDTERFDLSEREARVERARCTAFIVPQLPPLGSAGDLFPESGLESAREALSHDPCPGYDLITVCAVDSVGPTLPASRVCQVPIALQTKA